MVRTRRIWEWPPVLGGFSLFQEPRKRIRGWILPVRTKIRHRCPEVRSLRRIGWNLGEGTRQISPVTSGKGVPERLAMPGVQVAVTRGRRLFTKNIGGRKPERVYTAAESWPVAVPETWVQPG